MQPLGLTKPAAPLEQTAPGCRYHQRSLPESPTTPRTLVTGGLDLEAVRFRVNSQFMEGTLERMTGMIRAVVAV